MLRIMCIAKIHGATITETQLHYEGSITIPADLLEASGMLPNERVQVVNLSNGSRIETYVIEGEAGSGVICLNGPAARAGEVGDRVHILCYGMLDEEEAAARSLNVLYADESNRIVEQ
ncbi:MAG: aspartate 1-decarboxylase [Armatimonadota bacterium]|nr:aspartate 1-decarboxylase [Armatimonadota bacterium]